MKKLIDRKVTILYIKKDLLRLSCFSYSILLGENSGLVWSIWKSTLAAPCVKISWGQPDSVGSGL